MRKNLAFFIILILIITSALFLIPSSLSATNFSVPGTYATIQAAIDAALLPIPGPISDTITIGPGTYNEHLVINIPAGKQAGYQLYLEGSGFDSTIIDANAISRVIDISGAETVYISNMTITNGIAWGAGIMNDAILYLDNCIVRDNNSGSHGGGLDNGMKGNTYISNCKIINNFASISGGGIYSDSSGIVTIENSSIVGNTTFGGLSNGIDSPKKVIAKYNWWGSPSGPSGVIADPDTGTLANGTGDKVNGFVYFDPWLTSDPFAPAVPAAPIIKINEKPLSDYEKNISGFVTLLYNRILSRSPEKEGLDGWVEVLTNGSLTGANVVYEFIFSPECQNIISGYDYEQFITFLYKTLFNREPDAEGLKDWLDGMNSGIKKEEIVSRFTNSSEFVNLCKEFGIQP